MANSANTDAGSLAEENAALRARLEEAEDTLRAIRSGEVDALTVSGDGGERVYTLQGAEQPYRIMVETMSEGALVVTAEGLVLFSNHRFGMMLREPLQAIVGASLFSFVKPEDRECFSALCAQGREKSARGEVPLLCRDGTVVPAHLALSPLEIEGLQGVCIVVTDLTERIQMEEALCQQESLQQAKATAEAANQAKDQFLAKLSHELRTPLTPVLATVTAMETQEHLPDEVRADMDMIRRNVEMEAALIDDLLDVTKINRGKIDIHQEAADVHAILAVTVEICQAEIAAKHLEIRSEFLADRHHVWADQVRLRQVFWNLLKNAVKFTPEGSRITLRTRNVGYRLQIEIADTGIGIEPELLPRIFNAFEQGEQSKVRRFGGLGLGLNIARAVVELHQGRLTAFSEGKNKGATFTVDLATIAAQEEPATPTPHVELDERPLRILLVEDHPDTLNIFAKLLQKWGHAVTTAGTVKTAKEFAANQKFDLLISDLGLPDGSGLDVMRQVKMRSAIPGIALSGFGTDEDVRQSRDAGFAEHLVKPVSSDALRKSVHEFALHRT